MPLWQPEEGLLICVQLTAIRCAEAAGEEPPFSDIRPGVERNVLLPAKPRAIRVPLKAAEDAACTGDPMLRRRLTFVPSKIVLIAQPQRISSGLGATTAVHEPAVSG
jgi:hypothetical protein